MVSGVWITSVTTGSTTVAFSPARTAGFLVGLAFLGAVFTGAFLIALGATFLATFFATFLAAFFATFLATFLAAFLLPPILAFFTFFTAVLELFTFFFLRPFFWLQLS